MKDLFGNPIQERMTLQQAVNLSLDRLKTFEPPEGYWLADSGGRDSCVLLYLAKMAEVKFEAVYSVTTIDPPELIYFLRQHHHDTKWDRPKKPFLSMLLDRGFPLRTNRWCCNEYKERSGHGRRILLGVRWEESQRRATRKMVEQCYKDSSKTYVNPIIDWDQRHVWDFIHSEKIHYCSLYDEGFKRIGCVMCVYNYSRQEEAKRWPRFKLNFERAFIALYEKNKHRPSYQRWKNGIEMFDWWLSKKPCAKEQQVMIFG